MNDEQRQQQVFSSLPFYTHMFRDTCKAVLLGEAIEDYYPKWLTRVAKRFRQFNAILNFWYSLRHRDAIIITKLNRFDTKLAIYFEAVFRPSAKRFFLVEFIPSPKGAFREWLTSFLIRRTVYGIQVLSAGEQDEFAQRFSLPAEIFHFIPWCYSSNISASLGLGAQRNSQSTEGVVSSGRAACDWETLFRAAEGRDWPLTVICAKKDLDKVSTLNREERAQVLCEIPVIEHDRHVAAAAIYVLALRDVHRSCGHIRLCHAVSLGTPVVATRVRGLDGYCVDGETALLVDPEDPEAMREAIDRLLADRKLRDRLVRGALERSKTRTYEHYAQDIRDFVLAGYAHARRSCDQSLEVRRTHHLSISHDRMKGR